MPRSLYNLRRQGEIARLPGTFLGDYLQYWRKLSLALQFFIAGGIGLLLVMLVVGLWVTSQIREGVMRNSAATTALYVDSVIAPLLPDMRTSRELSDTVKRALDETLGQGALGKRLVSFKLWRRDGMILYAKDTALIGKLFEPNANLVAAFGGNVVAEYNDLDDDPESHEEKRVNAPLFEIYNPVREPWSGEVVAVSEFYEIADDFQTTLNAALWSSWLVVAGATATALALLSGIVFRGSHTIQTQRAALEAKVSELQSALSQNSSLRQRVQRASRRATAINERYLRRIGADLHDGPAQLVALAALRMDSPILLDFRLVQRAARSRDRRHPQDAWRGDARDTRHLQRPGAAADRDAGRDRHPAACGERARTTDLKLGGADASGPLAGTRHFREDQHLPFRPGRAEQCLAAWKRQEPGGESRGEKWQADC